MTALVDVLDNEVFYALEMLSTWCLCVKDAWRINNKNPRGDSQTRAHYSEGKHKLADCLNVPATRLIDYFFIHPVDINVSIWSIYCNVL